MTRPENVGRHPVLESREKLRQQLKSENYDGQGLRDTFEEYEKTVLDAIKDKAKAHRQLSNMAQALKVCTQIRGDRASVEYFSEIHTQYKSDNDTSSSRSQQ